MRQHSPRSDSAAPTDPDDEQEFAAHGIAGARVDRIAAAAQVNKQLIYAYFGSKEQLFDAVLATNCGPLVQEVPFDPDDLPGYVRLNPYRGDVGSRTR